MQYNPNYLKFRPIFAESELAHLSDCSKKVPVSILLDNIRSTEEIGIDFVFSSARLKGNTYDKHDTLALLKMGLTASGKQFSDAAMLINLRKSYEYLLAKVGKVSSTHEWKDFFLNTHSLISDNLLFRQEQGVVRQGGVQITGTEYNPLFVPQKLDDELNSLLSVAVNYANPFEKSCIPAQQSRLFAIFQRLQQANRPKLSVIRINPRRRVSVYFSDRQL